MADLKLIGIVILTLGLIGSVSYNVFETGNEFTCATNKPIGWNIIKDNGAYKEAVCPYTTKAPVYANCSSFRSTATYQNYGCQEVKLILVQEEVKTESKVNAQSYNCYPEPKGCDVQ